MILTAGGVLVLLIAGAFYWYELRPIQIKKECNRISQPTDEKQEFSARYGIGEYSVSSINERYKICLRSKGL